VLLLSQILKAVANLYRQEAGSRSFDSDSVRVLNKIEANLWSQKRRVAEEGVLVVLVEEMLGLVQAVWLKGMMGLQSN
jgi:hypothetical protein